MTLVQNRLFVWEVVIESGLADTNVLGYVVECGRVIAFFPKCSKCGLKNLGTPTFSLIADMR
jgi:hypothetical protein